MSKLYLFRIYDEDFWIAVMKKCKRIGRSARIVITDLLKGWLEED